MEGLTRRGGSMVVAIAPPRTRSRDEGPSRRVLGPPVVSVQEVRFLPADLRARRSGPSSRDRLHPARNMVAASLRSPRIGILIPTTAPELQSVPGGRGAVENPLRPASEAMQDTTLLAGRGRAQERGSDRRARRSAGRKRTSCTLTTGGPSTRRDGPRSCARERGGATSPDGERC